MITYLATPGYTHPMERFVTHWDRDLAGKVHIRTYEEALRAEELPAGTYIFADIERLLAAEVEIATLVWNQLDAAGARMLNHPTRTLKRYDLLTKLHALGRNTFRVAHATDRNAELRFPVFIRDETEHSGSLSKLLNNRKELDQTLAGAIVRGHRVKDLLVVEYCENAGSDGLFRKYSAFTIGGRIVPGHMDCSRQWVVKDTDLVTPEVLAQERAYLEANPHRAWLEETFAIAGVDWGRVDYSLVGDTPQVWEINTNPILLLNPDEYGEEHMETKRFLTGQLGPAIAALDTVGGEAKVAIDVPVPLFTRLDFERKKRDWAIAHRRAFRKLKGSAAFRVFRRIVHPLLGPLAPLITRSGRSSDKH